MTFEMTDDDRNFLEGLRSISQNTALSALGIEIVELSTDHIVLTMPITDDHRQPMGLLHGGVSMLLAESAASSHSVYGIDLNEKVPVGIEISGSHLSSAREGTVRAEARVLRRSRSFIFHEVDIIHAETGKLLTKARTTNYYKPIRPQPE